MSVVPECRPLSFVQFIAVPEAFASVAVGVGQLCATVVRLGPPSRFGLSPGPRLSVARGVGHCVAFAIPDSVGLPRAYVSLVRTASAVIGVGQSVSVRTLAMFSSEGLFALGRSNAPPTPLIPFWLDPYGVAVGVGHIDQGNEPGEEGPRCVCEAEPAIATMRSSGLLSAVTAPLRIEPHRGQVAEDFLERLTVVDGEESGDVLKEYDGGRTIVDRTTYRGPEPSFIICSQTLAGHARALAREARNEEIHESTEASAWEGGEIGPDRSLIQPPFFHARDQNTGGCDFTLHVADRANASNRPSESQVDSSVAGAHGDDVDVGIDGS